MAAGGSAATAAPRTGEVVVSPGSLEASLTPGALRQPAAAARQDAEAAATVMLRLWARPDVTGRAWFSDLAPHLSAAGRQDYAHTDPAALPRLTVTGPARVAATSHGMWATVTVATSLGVFGVELTRPTPTAGWLVERLTFPAGVS